MPFSQAAIALRGYATFPVPVFLALSLYLSAKTIARKGSLRLGRKLSRLLVPYGFFTVFYLLFYAIQGSGLSPMAYLKRLGELIGNDPAGVIFLGQAATPLYFLPLLAIGTVGMQWINRLLTRLLKDQRIKDQKSHREWMGKWMAIATLLSAIAYQLLTVSGNAFVLGNRNLAFQTWASDSLLEQPLVRVGLVYIAWLCWCLPYIFGAFYLASRPLPTGSLSTERSNSDPIAQRHQLGSTLLIAGTVLAIALQPTLAPIDTLRDVLLALLMVACGIQLSHSVNRHQNRIIAISRYAFGIYLIHPVLLFVAGKLLPNILFQNRTEITAIQVLTFLIFGFVSSLTVTAALDKIISKPILRKCLGL